MSERRLKKKLEHLERYSQDFNIRVLGVKEDEDCMAVIMDYLTHLGFEEAPSEVENAHRIGKNNKRSQADPLKEGCFKLQRAQGKICRRLHT